MYLILRTCYIPDQSHFVVLTTLTIQYCMKPTYYKAPHYTIFYILQVLLFRRKCISNYPVPSDTLSHVLLSLWGTKCDTQIKQHQKYRSVYLNIYIFVKEREGQEILDPTVTSVLWMYCALLFFACKFQLLLSY
jgi:hypothetical protein